jgi:hypothetical protein
MKNRISRITRIFSLILVLALMFSMTAVSASAATSYTTGQYTVTTSKGLNVRASASTSGKINGAAAKGASFTVTKVSGSWGYTSSIKTTKGTVSGWVCLDYCQKSTTITASLSAISITQGNGAHVTGTIKSTGSKLQTITTKILNAAGTKQISTISAKTVTVNTYSYTLKDSAIDNAIAFSKLPAGIYKLQLTIKTADGTTKTASTTVTVKTKSTQTATTTTTTTTNSTKTTTTGIYKNMVLYAEGNYANYYVVNGFDTAYCYNQNNYSRFVMGGKNVGCTATANATALSIKRGKAVSPNTIGWGSQGCNWTSTAVVKSSDGDSSGYGKQTQLTLIAQELLKGNAVIVRANAYHTVTAIGLRNGANTSNIQVSDILIADPANGKVTTLDKAVHGYSYQSGWSLLIAV